VSRILLGVTGSIAAYKSLEFVRLADSAGHSVRVLQTPTSLRFVGSASFEALTGAPVLVGEFDEDPARGAFPGQTLPAHRPLHHLEVVRNAELYVIAPASANTIAKLAHGLADSAVTTAALAGQCPLLIAPAMNNHMYEHAATQANLALLLQRGAHVVGPQEGKLASKGEQGMGRLAEPQAILQACARLLSDGGSWRGVRVLVTAGGTREPIDAVRFVGNRSSGRMGLALAEAAHARGAEVTMVAANVALAVPDGIRTVPVSTAAELAEACEREFGACDVLLMAAAVADFRPADPAEGKLKKAGRERLQVELEATPDVLSALAARRTADQTLVGFAAEHGAQMLPYARRKLETKGLDAVVANDVSATDSGFDVDANEVVILTGAGEVHLGRASKREIAEGILDAVAPLRKGGPATVDNDGRAPVRQRLRALPTRL
jgi:phosphopantothenoylcysteine decarboxylase/phosphopantothenate--cysteine ligase